MVKWVFVKSYNNRLEAELAQGLLEGYDITAKIVADDYGGLGPHLLTGTGGVKLMVPADDFKVATELLKDADLDIDGDYDSDEEDEDAELNEISGYGDEADDEDEKDRW